jgi:hypothetical protein
MVPINSEAEFAVAGTALDFRQLIRISSNESRMCPPCDVELDGIHKFEDCCNHLLHDHELKCVHVGQETSALADPIIALWPSSGNKTAVVKSH